MIDNKKSKKQNFVNCQQLPTKISLGD